MTVLVECSSPGKVIIGGEHAVVYGYPSIVSALDLRMNASITLLPAPECSINLRDIGLSLHGASLDGLLGTTSSKFRLVNIVLDALRDRFQKPFPGAGFSIHAASSIPIGAGMGSSAATCALFTFMLSRWYGVELKDRDLLDIARQAEMLYHENPSGIDTTATIQGGAFMFENGKIVDVVDKVTINGGQIIVANTNVPRSTSILVHRVKEWHARDPARAQVVFESIKSIVLGTWRCFKEHSTDVHDLGRAFTRNHDALSEMGVSIPVIDEILKVSMENGATGGKLTGAGGGGCVLIAVPEGMEGTLMKILARKGFTCFLARIGPVGLICSEKVL